jgi:hypothetical protein
MKLNSSEKETWQWKKKDTHQEGWRNYDKETEIMVKAP